MTKPRQKRAVTRIAREGMTLIEVMIAITILATAMLSIAAFMAKFAHAVAISDVRNTASEIASQALEQAKTSPRYSAIDSLYAGTTNLVAPYVGYSKTMIVTRTGGTAPALYDYKTLTVIVNNSRLDAPVKRSTIIAAY